MKKNLLTLLLTLCYATFFISCSEPSEIKKVKASISVSTFALYDMTKFLAEETIDIQQIIPPGMDIHAFEPTPKSMARIESSDLVLYNGAGLEPWLSSFVFKGKSIAIGEYLALAEIEEGEEHSHHEHENCSGHGTLDPHIWFDIEHMKRMTEIVSYELISLQPRHKELYLKKKDMYIKMLEALDASYTQALESCKINTIVTDHNAFSYVAHRYNFHVTTLSGVSPDAEIAPKEMIRVLKEVKAKGVRTVFFENFSSSKTMKSVAEQAKVEIASLHPLSNVTQEEFQMKRSYEDIMRANLEKIAKARECH